MTGQPGKHATDPALNRRVVEVVRARADEQWDIIKGRVARRAETVTRRSLPVRAAASGGPTFVSEQVLRAGVLDAVAGVDSATATQIDILTDPATVYRGVRITVWAVYGVDLLAASDQIVTRAKDALTAMLGPVDPPVVEVDMHVHVADVRGPGTD
ncbi:MAG: hypothetical protein ACRCXL_02850 [Dermatophilaceae bacterium]